MGEDGTAYTNQVSAREACQALETIANLLFLTASTQTTESWYADSQAKQEAASQSWRNLYGHNRQLQTR